MRFVNNLKTAFLLGAMMALCMLVGHLVGGAGGLIIGLLFGLVGNGLGYFFSDKIALAANRAQEVTRADIPWLVDMVDDLAARAGLPPPRVYVCPQAAPNAFATGRNPRNAAVAITEGMLRNFPRDEIAGVMAHELAHVKHRDVLISTIAAVMAGIISYAGYMLFYLPGGGGGRSENQNPLGAIGAIVMILLAPLAATLIQLAISRQREFAADNFAGELTSDPLCLARALSRLHHGNERIPTDTNPAFHALYICEPLHGGVASLFSTHPPIEQRIEKLRRQAQAM
ncbi:MAG: M48 family metalloprotease [Phycisphaerae bacterium]